MVHAKPLPERVLLLATFRYEPETGKLFWREKASRKFPPGTEAGSWRSKGYPMVCLNYETYSVHRLVWKMQTGVDPVEVDHANGDRADNRWANLREATSSENHVNRAALNRHRGVHYIRRTGKWGAQIKMDKAHYWLGSFNAAEEACAAYRAKAKELHAEFRKPKTCSCL